jgi:hypothetical protein
MGLCYSTSAIGRRSSLLLCLSGIASNKRRLYKLVLDDCPCFTADDIRRLLKRIDAEFEPIIHKLEMAKIETLRTCPDESERELDSKVSYLTFEADDEASKMEKRLREEIVENHRLKMNLG